MYIFVLHETIMKASMCPSDETLSAAAAPTVGLFCFSSFHEISRNYVVALDFPYRITQN